MASMLVGEVTTSSPNRRARLWAISSAPADLTTSPSPWDWATEETQWHAKPSELVSKLSFKAAYAGIITLTDVCDFTHHKGFYRWGACDKIDLL